MEGNLETKKRIREIVSSYPEAEHYSHLADLHRENPDLPISDLRQMYQEELREHQALCTTVDASEKKETEPKRQKPHVSLSPRDIACLVDVVQTEDGLKYLIKEASGLVLRNEIEVKGQVHVPPKTVKLFAPATERALEFYESDSDATLFNDLCAFVYEHIDHQEPIMYKVVAVWIMHTYLIESFDYSPYLYLYGPIGTGKSKQGEILVLLGCRGLFTVGIREAGIFRVTEHFSPTFVIDELSIWRKDGNSDIQELLNTRFQRGAKVVRINMNKDGLDAVETFNVFGATAVCTTEEVPAALRSRRLLIVMDKNTRKVRRKVDVERGKVLKDRLTAFRARHLGEVLDVPDQLVSDARLDDVVLPLHQIIRLCSPDSEKEFMEYVKGVETERKEEASTSLDAKVVEAVATCSHLVESGKFLVSDVTLEFNRGLPEKEQKSDRSIGRLLTRLGFKSTRVTGGKRARRWDEERLRRLQERYSLDSPEMSLTSLTSLTAPHSHAESDVSDNSDVFPRMEKEETNVSQGSEAQEATSGEEAKTSEWDDLLSGGDIPF